MLDSSSGFCAALRSSADLIPSFSVSLRPAVAFQMWKNIEVRVPCLDLEADAGAGFAVDDQLRIPQDPVDQVGRRAAQIDEIHLDAEYPFEFTVQPGKRGHEAPWLSLREQDTEVDIAPWAGLPGGYGTKEIDSQDLGKILERIAQPPSEFFSAHLCARR